MLKPATRAETNKRLAREAIAGHYRTYDDPVRAELERQAETCAEATTSPLAGVLTDVQGSPRESLNLTLYGQVLAERERLRRSVE